MEQLTKNQAVATSQEAVQNQNEPQLRDENAHNDKSVHGVLNPTYQAGLRRDAVQPDIEAERKKRDEIEESGLTPSQLYVFMPPNLGGFFMVRSYYPSECHADYFDFERIEALKPAIEACGISTLSQSPMLG